MNGPLLDFKNTDGFFIACDSQGWLGDLSPRSLCNSESGDLFEIMPFVQFNDDGL